MKSNKRKNYDDYVNYKTTNRKKVHFLLKENNIDNTLIFDDKKIIITENNFFIDYNKIQRIEISLCSRIYNPSIISSNPLEIVKMRWKKGIVGTTNKGVHLIYSVDFNIYTNDKLYCFESYSLNNILQIIEILFIKNVKIEDPIDIYSILINNKDMSKLQKYLDMNFQFIAKKYNLDNPRGILLNKE